MAAARVSEVSGENADDRRMDLTFPSRIVVLLGAFWLLLGAAAPVPPAVGEQQAVRRAVARGEVLSLDRILRLTEQHVKGEILKVELEHSERGLKYEVKVLTASGRVREVELDARTGALLKIEND